MGLAADGPATAASEPASAPFALSTAELLQQFDDSQQLAGIGSWSWDLRTNEIAWSKETYRVLRVPFDQVPTFERVLSRAVDAAHAQAFLEHLDAALRGERDYDFEIAARVGDDGAIVIVHTRGVVERDPAGAPLRMTGTVQDVTAIRQAEQAIRESEARFRVLTEASPIGIFRTDAAGQPSYANQRLLDLFGADMDAFASGAWLERVHRDDVADVLQRARATIGRNAPFDLEYRIVVDDQVRFVWVRTQPVLDEMGQVSGHVGSVLETTAERRAEAERTRLQSQLEQARRLESLGLLAGGISHDFNNLLVGILANASLVREASSLPAMLREALDDIVRSAERAGELTRQLLAYAGRAEPERRAVPLEAVLHELGALLKPRFPAPVTLTIDVTPQAVVQADATQLRQVLLNLLTNAVDAIGDRAGYVAVRVTRETLTNAELARAVLGPDRPAGEYVVVSVHDTGIGMTAEVRERMFDPFFTTKGSGRGLGLAATLGILQSHAGAIQVESSPATGTTVRLLLPATELPIPEPPYATVGETATLKTNDAGHGTLLLVDDDDGARGAAKRILSRTGFTVIEARNGQDALTRFAHCAEPPRALILDLSMPVMGGAECLATLRAQGHETPVLIVSGFDPDDIASRLVQESNVRLLRKPYQIRELLTAVQQLLA
jgi:two-component system, cell cycle sensor histidine kinase and response regulator CckA